MSREILYTEASLSDSYLFKELNHSTGASKTIAEALKTGTILDASYIEEQLIQCKRSRISVLMDDVLDAFNKGEIKLVYNKAVRVSVAIPFVVMTIGGKTSAFIFISDFSGISADSASLTIEMKKLYTLMESAYIGKLFYTRPALFQRSGALMKIVATVYAGMSMRIFNKEFALSLNKDVYDKVNYYVARFCLESMCEMKDSNIIKNYAASTCNSPDSSIIDVADNDYTASSIVTINALIQTISGTNPKMAKLNFRYYFERWISTYGTSAALSIDALPYLIFAITNTLLGSFMVNVQTLSDIVKNTKNIKSFYSEINKIM